MNSNAQTAAMTFVVSSVCFLFLGAETNFLTLADSDFPVSGVWAQTKHVVKTENGSNLGMESVKNNLIHIQYIQSQLMPKNNTVDTVNTKSHCMLYFNTLKRRKLG